MGNIEPDNMETTMKSTKYAIDHADLGQMKQEAQKHYEAAEQAKLSNKKDECLKECDAAIKELYV
jgi:hypothetical protein